MSYSYSPDAIRCRNVAAQLVWTITVEAAQAFGVDVEKLARPATRGGDRKGLKTRQLSRARHAAMWLSRHLLYDPERELGTYPQLGRAFKRHHTTIMNGEQRATAHMASNPYYYRTVMGLYARLKPLVAESLGQNPQLIDGQFQPATGNQSTTGAGQQFERIAS